MKRILLAVMAAAILAGCAHNPPKQSEQSEFVDRVYREVLKYELMYGTPEEQKKAPITDAEVDSVRAWMNKLNESSQ